MYMFLNKQKGEKGVIERRGVSEKGREDEIKRKEREREKKYLIKVHRLF